MKEQQRQAYLDQIDYGRIERVIAYKNVQFIIDHQHDTREQLTAYLKSCTERWTSTGCGRSDRGRSISSTGLAHGKLRSVPFMPEKSQTSKIHHIFVTARSFRIYVRSN